MISIYLNLLRIDLWPKMWSILENVPWALEKKMYSSAFGWNVLKISMRSISSNISFKTYFVLMILVSLFCFDDLSIGVSGVLTSPIIIVLLSISPFTSVNVCFMYWLAPMLGAQIFVIVMSSSWIDPLIIMWCPSLCLIISFILRSILSDMRIATPAFFCFPFALNIFFNPLTFSLFVSLSLNWVSCKQHIYGSYFCIHSANLCLLVGTFKPFTFKVIIDIYVPIAIFSIVWGWFCRSFFFSCISWLYKPV